MKKLILILGVFILGAGFLAAQVDPFMPPHPITMGQGGAFTANPEGFNSFYYNPAGFAREGEFTLLSLSGYAFADQGLVNLMLDALRGEGALAASSRATEEDDFLASLGISAELAGQFEALGTWASDLTTAQQESALTALKDANYVTQEQIDAAGDDFGALAVALLPLISDPDEFAAAINTASSAADGGTSLSYTSYNESTFKAELTKANNSNALPSGNVRAGANLGIAYAGNGFGIGLFAGADATFTGANLLASRGRIMNTLTLAVGFAFPIGPVTLGVQARPTILGYSDVNPAPFILSAQSGGSTDVSSLIGDIYTGFRIGLDVGALMDLGPFTFGAVLKDIIPFQLTSASRYTLDQYGSEWLVAPPLGTGADLSPAEIEALYSVPPMKFNLGASFHPDLGVFANIIDPRVSIDIHDVFGFVRKADENTLISEDRTILNHINVGADIKILRFISARAGYTGTGGGGLTAGLGLKLFFLDLNAAVAATELKEVNGEYQFKNIGFSFETAFRF
ncbi:MAG: conjugal transfer protein TraF [Spirochaetales bacterium]|nr:conjugal transfer protein TraF [Spirochaetales bacterium]